MKKEIIHVQKHNTKFLSPKQIAQHIADYEKSHQGQPVFVELLSRMGMLGEDWLEYSEANPTSYQTRVLKMYQQHIVVQLEKQLLYKKNNNAPSIMFYLKKIEPARFGEKVIEIKTRKVNARQLYDDMKNESGIDLMKLSPVC